jgi:hypothetical protein
MRQPQRPEVLFVLNGKMKVCDLDGSRFFTDRTGELRALMVAR